MQARDAAAFRLSFFLSRGHACRFSFFPLFRLSGLPQTLQACVSFSAGLQAVRPDTAPHDLCAGRRIHQIRSKDT